MRRTGPQPAGAQRRSGAPPLSVPSGRGDRRRQLSQNFIRDPKVVATFLAALPKRPQGAAIEIGAGDGALTQALAEHFGSLTAWEIDPDMTQLARSRLPKASGVVIKIGDFLESPIVAHPFHLVGNVPFGITTRIVEWCLAAPALQTATVITQLEYGRKRTGDYGRWSKTTVMSWPEFDWRLAGQISRGSFRPVPAVDACVLSLSRRPEPLVSTADRQRWRRDVETGFIGFGGSLFASLSRHYSRRAMASAFTRAGLAHDTIVAFVHPNAWLTVFDALGQGSSGNYQARSAIRHLEASNRRA